MKTLALPPFSILEPRKDSRPKTNPATLESIPKISQLVKSKEKSGSTWFNPDAPENLTVKEAIVRAAFVITMPMLAAIDWNYGTHSLYFIIPTIFYLEITAFTLSCPIKAMFSNYSHPSKYE